MAFRTFDYLTATVATVAVVATLAIPHGAAILRAFRAITLAVVG